MDTSFKILLENINSQLDILNANNFKVYDEENPDFYIDVIYYNKEDDKLYFRCKEEE